MYPPFVDRSDEMRLLRELAEGGFYPVLYIYGPEGCGKTRLLSELYRLLHGREGFLVVYVDATEASSLGNAIASIPEVLQVVFEVVGEVAGAPGRLVAKLLPLVLRRLKERLVRGKHVVVLVDDVARSLGLDLVELYAKKLADSIDVLYEKGAETVFMLATTSEGLSRSILARHNYVMLAQLWNLSREAHDELLGVLGAPRNVYEDSWLVTGGNPRMILMLARLHWNKERLLTWIERNMRAALSEILEGHRGELLEVLEDIDSLVNHPSLARKLIEANLVTPIDRPCLGYTPPVDESIGVGRNYAWQTPAYMHALHRILRP